MPRVIARCLVILASLFTLVACQSQGARQLRGPLPSIARLAVQDWELQRLGETEAPRGADDEPLTLRFDPRDARAHGFAGCNRYTASYLISTDRLGFGGPVATRRYCEGAMEVEQAYLAMLSKVIRYELSAEGLALYGTDGLLARYRATPR